MNDSNPKPATDEEIAALKNKIGHYVSGPIDEVLSLIARIDADRATIANQAEEIADKSNVISQYRDACSRYLDRADQAEERQKNLDTDPSLSV